MDNAVLGVYTVGSYLNKFYQESKLPQEEYVACAYQITMVTLPPCNIDTTYSMLWKRKYFSQDPS